MDSDRILNGFCSLSQCIQIAFSMDFGRILKGVWKDSHTVWNDSQWIDFEMLWVGFPIDFGKDFAWIPNWLCEVSFPIDFEMFWSDSPLMLEGHCMGFTLDLLWFVKFSVDFERGVLWCSIGSGKVWIGFSIDSERIRDGFQSGFFRKVLWSDSSMILKYFWSGSPLILNWLRMDSPLFLWGFW